MNALSIIIVIVAAGGFIFGYRRGIVREAVSLIAVILGIITCRLYSEPAANAMIKLLHLDPEGASFSQYIASITGCLALFVIVWLTVYLIGRLLRGTIHTIKLGFLDSCLGALYCCAKWTIILSLLLNIIFIIAPSASMWGDNPPQGIIKINLEFAPWLFGIISDTMQ